jgi:hypothetical protein
MFRVMGELSSSPSGMESIQFHFRHPLRQDHQAQRLPPAQAVRMPLAVE